MSTKKLQILGSFGSSGGGNVGGGTVEVDTTLSQAGKAADAKAVGDAVNRLNTLVGDTNVSEQITNALNNIGQPDWNQSDETAPDYIKNRTHWAEEPVTTVETLLEETAVEFDEYGQEPNGLPIKLIDGAVLTVTWDGVEYTTTAHAVTFPEIGDCVVAGNPMLIGFDPNAEDNGQPFTIAYILAYGMSVMVSSVQEAVSHTIKIVSSNTTQEFHKLDSRYIPEHLYKWDNISGKPFVTTPSDMLVFADSTEGCASFIVDGIKCVKVSDVILTSADCSKGMEVLIRVQAGQHVGIEDWVPISANEIQGAFTEDEFCVMELGQCLMLIVPHDNYDWEGLIIPESGIYVGTAAPIYRIAAINIPGYDGFNREVLDVRYLPDNIGGGEDITVDSTPTSGSDNPVSSGGVYDALNQKQNTITGAASTITTSNLTPDMALISDASGKVGVSTVTAFELGYLKGVTQSIQEQLDTNNIAASLAMPGSLKWDGVIGDREHIIMVSNGNYNMCYVHISDEYPTLLDNVPMYVAINEGGCTFAMPADYEMQDDGVMMIGETFVAIPFDNYTMEGITFKKGIYTMAYHLGPMGYDVSVMYGSALYIMGYVFKSGNESASKYFEKINGVTYVGDTLTWDGNIDGRVCVNSEIPDAGTEKFVKISDSILTLDDISQGFSCTVLENGESTSVTVTPEETELLFEEDGYGALKAAIVIPYDNYNVGDLGTFPESGIYFAKVTMQMEGQSMSMQSVSLTVPGYNFASVTPQEVIKTEHLPEALRFGEIEVGSDTLTWDGNTEGLASVPGDLTLYKVSNNIPTLADLYNGYTSIIRYTDGREDKVIIVSKDEAANTITSVNDGKLIALSGTIAISYATTEIDGVLVQPGTYFIHGENVNGGYSYISSLTINGYSGFEGKEKKLVKIDPKYLPDGMGGGSGSGLPEVTASDNGKSLSVVNGEWVVKKSSYNDLSDKPTLFSGSYNDLSDKPTLGTAAYTNSTDYATAGHSQSASKVTAGTFAGQVVANSSGQSYSTSLLRNSKLVSQDTTPTVNGEICWKYE